MDSVFSSSTAFEVSPLSPQAGSLSHDDTPSTAERLVMLVERPADWQPADVRAIPPGIEVQRLATDTAAAAFVRMFNDREAQQPSGRWAIDLANASAVIVPCAEGWQPSGPNAVPPNIEVHKQPSAELAEIFAENFNRLEMVERSAGFWAIGPTPANGLRVDGDSFDVIDEHNDDDDDYCDSLRETDDRSRPDDFDRMFPDLPVIVVAADGAERVEHLPDPRAAFARQLSRYGDTVKHAPAVKLRTTAMDPPTTDSDSGLMRLAAMGSVPMKGGA